MAKTTKNLTTLEIHKLVSQEQYDNAKTAGLLNDDALYLVPDNHSHGNLDNEGRLSTSDAVVITDSSGNLTTSETISVTELGYLNGVTSNIQTQLAGKAPLNHASSATTYGVSSSTVYGHAKASGTTPKANGTATVGSETSSFATGDHVHPLQTSVSGSSGSCTGNAATATKATQDGNGRNIVNTYATKSELTTFSLDAIYPVGSIYISMAPTNPAVFLGGIWESLEGDKTFWIQAYEASEGGSGSGAVPYGNVTYPAVTPGVPSLMDAAPVSAGLPNITGSFTIKNTEMPNNVVTAVSGAFTSASTSSDRTVYDRSTTQAKKVVTFNASNSNSIYGASNTVRPPAYRVYAWKRLSDDVTSGGSSGGESGWF